MTVFEIQMMLYKSITGCQLMAPNIYLWDEFESDFISVTNAGYIREFEIKLSLSDFYNDAKKNDRYTGIAKYDWLLSGKGPNEFYYLFEDGTIPDEKIPEWAGIAKIMDVKKSHCGTPYTVKECVIRRSAKRLHNNKITTQKENVLYKSLYYRYWELQRKRIKEKQGQILML